MLASPGSQSQTYQHGTREITQENLAELADLNIRTVQKIESGELNVLVTTAIRLQRSLGCKWNDLLP
jgi:DNA-binding XRE family transcriptional regulator